MASENDTKRHPVLTIWIPNEPVPKARARHRNVRTRAGQEFVTSYTPKKSVMFENWVRHCALDEIEKLGDGFLGMQGALGLRLRFYLQRPKSVSIKKRKYPEVKPDLDNLEKSVMDGLKLAGAYKNDSQVCDLSSKKRYHNEFYPPGVGVSLWTIA